MVYLLRPEWSSGNLLAVSLSFPAARPVDGSFNFPHSLALPCKKFPASMKDPDTRVSAIYSSTNNACHDPYRVIQAPTRCAEAHLQRRAAKTSKHVQRMEASSTPRLLQTQFACGLRQQLVAPDHDHVDSPLDDVCPVAGVNLQSMCK